MNWEFAPGPSCTQNSTCCWDPTGTELPGRVNEKALKAALTFVRRTYGVPSLQGIRQKHSELFIAFYF